MKHETEIPSVGAYEHFGSNAGSKDCNWAIRKLTMDDLKEVIRKGWDDFFAMPTHLPFLLIIYPLVTFMAVRYYGNFDILPVVFPAFAGFTLLGPIIALGMYELSRRRESGVDTSRWHTFQVIHSPHILSIAALSIILMVIYFIWMMAASFVYIDIIGGVVIQSVDEFINIIFLTAQGQRLIFVGCSMGLVFSIIVLCISVTSFPMLLDRQVNPIKAIEISINVAFENPVIIGAWGLIVAVSLFLGALPFLVGLAVVLPVLGHSTWHLYRKAVILDIDTSK